MKRLLFLFLSLSAFAACNSYQKSHTPQEKFYAEILTGTWEQIQDEKGNPILSNEKHRLLLKIHQSGYFFKIDVKWADEMGGFKNDRYNYEQYGSALDAIGHLGYSYKYILKNNGLLEIDGIGYATKKLN